MGRFLMTYNCISPRRFRLFGEVPKRLKGHPWKGCRSLIAARGFKSLLLREAVTLYKELLFPSKGLIYIKPEKVYVKKMVNGAEN